MASTFLREYLLPPSEDKQYPTAVELMSPLKKDSYQIFEKSEVVKLIGSAAILGLVIFGTKTYSEGLKLDLRSAYCEFVISNNVQFPEGVEKRLLGNVSFQSCIDSELERRIEENR